MASNDDRKVTGGLAILVDAKGKAGNLGGKKVTKVQRVLTEKDPFDLWECHLTPERVEELTQENPVTGEPPLLVGTMWKGRATRDEDGNVVPAEYEEADQSKSPKRGRRHKAEE